MGQTARSPKKNEPAGNEHRGRHRRFRRLLGYTWFRIFAIGFGLLVLLEISFLIGKNANLVPAMLIYGAFLVPITLIAYLYETLPDWEVPFPLLAICLLVGGAVGVSIASPLEIHLLPPLGSFQYLAAGLIEESSKLIVPVAVFLLVAFRSVAAGVIVGIASAMGFSGLESAGYGFSAFFSNAGASNADTLANVLANPYTLVVLDTSFVVRALTDPVGHATWTALTCYVLFAERQKAGRFVLNWRVAAAFVLAVLLHAAWDSSLLITPPNTVGHVALRISFVFVLIFTFWLLARIIRKSRAAGETGPRPAAP